MSLHFKEVKSAEYCIYAFSDGFSILFIRFKDPHNDLAGQIRYVKEKVKTFSAINVFESNQDAYQEGYAIYNIKEADITRLDKSNQDVMVETVNFLDAHGFYIRRVITL